MTDSPIDHLGTGMPGTSPAHDLDLGDDHDATGQEMEARALEAEAAHLGSGPLQRATPPPYGRTPAPQPSPSGLHPRHFGAGGTSPAPPRCSSC